MATPTQIRRRGRWSVILGTVFAAVMFAAVAYADNLQGDDLAAGESAIKAQGASGDARFYLVSNGSDGCNVDGSNPATVTVSSNQAWLVLNSPGTVSLTGCGEGNAKTIGYTVSASAPVGGIAEISGVASGGKSGNNGYNNNPGSFNVTVVAGDSTPPSISYVLDPASPDGANGWYTSDVSLTWTVTENESPSSLVKTGCVDQSITADQVEATYSCSATSDGGTATQVDVKIKRDATSPTISGAVLPAAPDGSNGWYKTAPTVTFTCGDATSLVASCAADGTSPASASKTLGESVSAQSVGGTATDNAGNANTASVSGLKVDLSDPTVESWNGSIADGDSFYFGSVPAASTCTAADAISGPSGCAVTGYSTAVGNHTLTATATDNAGRTGTETRSYSVLAWTLNGFYQPVDMNNVVNSVKNGATVPLKFEVFAGATELTDTAAVMSLTAAKINCDATAPLAEVETTSTGATSLRYDATGGQFIYNWQTPKTAGQCYRVTMTTQDASTLVAYFRLK